MDYGKQFFGLSAEVLHSMAVDMMAPVDAMPRNKRGLADKIGKLFVECCRGARDVGPLSDTIDNVKAKIQDKAVSSHEVIHSRNMYIYIYIYI
jgi:hypothetical protein